MNLDKIDFTLPVSIQPFQYDLNSPVVVSYVEKVESILLDKDNAKRLLDWLFNGSTHQEWRKFIENGEHNYIDNKTQRSPFFF